MAWWNWSKTSDNNATADSSINWAEGQLPSTVNNSARAMMARAAEWRDDISGVLTTGGTSAAYTLASNQVFDTLANMNGAMVAFVPHVTNAADATINVDGLGAKPIRWAPSQNVQSNLLIAGTPYAATYFSATNEWILQGMGGNPYGVPLGVGMEYWGATSPGSAFAFPAGQALSRTAYSSLFSLMGTTHGVGDGSTTFNLPDKRGKLSAALDNLGGGSSAGLLTLIASTTLGATGGAQSAAIAANNLPTASPWSATATVTVSGTAATAGAHNHTGTTDAGASSAHNHNTPAPTTLSNGVQTGGTGGFWFGSTTGITDPENQNMGHTHTFTASTDPGHTHSVTASGTPVVTMGTNSGGGQAYNKLPPLIVCNYILRVI